MAFFPSLRQLPELGNLTKLEQECVLRQFRLFRSASVQVRLMEVGIVIAVIVAEVVGLFGGWILSRSLWGSLAGALLAILAVLMLCYYARHFFAAWKLRRFLRSEQGRFALRHTKEYEAFMLLEEKTTHET